MKPLATILVLAAATFTCWAQDRPGGPAATQDLSVILGRPTDKSVAANVLSAEPMEAYVEFGPAGKSASTRTAAVALEAGRPREIAIEGLDRDKQYVYRLQTRRTGEGDWSAGTEATFRTQRAPGSTFVFGVQGDSHPERPGKMFDGDLYLRTLAHVAKDRPDFYITLGDDFSIERLIERKTLSQASVDHVYASQRRYLGVVGASSPLFLVNGNHEQAARCNLDGTASSLAVLAGLARTRFFPLPAPDEFYTGNAEKVEHLGLPRDYYAWTWGDALFVVIDPYWHSAIAVDNQAGAEGKQREPRGGKAGPADEADRTQSGGKKRDLWQVTLGEEQYRWLARTLTGSKARWKFVFCHHVLGTGRGGVECAPLYEWGGQNRKGRDELKQKRPGWDLPIHQLMVKAGVTILFQGHDHLFAKQELDGVIYQSCPCPADPTYTAFNREAYRSGDVLPNSGHLRVTVATAKVRVEYVRSYLPKDATAEHPDDEASFAYEIPSASPGNTGAMPASPAPTTRPAAGTPAQVGPRQNPSRAGPPPGIFQTAVPEHPLDIVLGRPIADSVTLSILCFSDVRACIAYGANKQDLSLRTAVFELKKSLPQEITLDKLKRDTRYYYRLCDAAGKPLGDELGEGTFQTQRAAGKAFTFTIQADSHLDLNTSLDVYRRTLANVAADAPDFHIDLGDTFMVDKHASRETAATQYLAQRYYLGLVGRSAPIFLVVGNHDGEDARLLRGGADSLAVWSNTMRKRYFPNPMPDGFYTGNVKADPRAGMLQDYYAWEWGNALFIVLNPYWHATGRPSDDCWNLTLGPDQYKWLTRTLEASKARLKFVFVHQLLGGVDKQGRGGAEAAVHGEWGGRNADGSDGFASRRAGWAMPIHQLLVRYGVNVVFHGHDHLFAKQELGGIVYHAVPQPGFPGSGPPRSAAEYGYLSGTILGGAGHLRVKIDGGNGRIEYIRSTPTGNESHQGGQVEFVYEVTGAGN